MGQFEFIQWLAYWYLQTESFEFEWDNGNLTKSNLNHGIECGEVESIFVLKFGVPIGIQISPAVEEDRFCIVGFSHKGRALSIVFTIRNRKIRPISSRLASKKERNIYEKIRKTIKGIR